MAQCAKGDGGGDKGRDAVTPIWIHKSLPLAWALGCILWDSFFFFFLFPFVFLGPFLQHMEVPMLRVELEL